MVSAAALIGKYALVLIMGFYMIGSFGILRVEDPGRLRAAFVRQLILIFLFYTVGFSVILLHETTLEILLLYLAELTFMILYAVVFRTAYKNSSRVILSHLLMFLAIGFIMLTRLNFDKALRQFMMTAAAGLLTLVVPKLFRKMRTAEVFAYTAGGIGIVLLVVVLILSPKTYGANLSIDLGFFAFQPSEFVKISFVLLIAVLFRKDHSLKMVLLSGLAALLHVLILVASTDLGGAVIYAAAYLFMVYAATEKKRYLFSGLAIGAAAAAAAFFMFSHVRIRFEIFRDPWPLFYGKGNQVGNSLLGIANGGFLGTGIYQGGPKYIPVVEKDFIFSAIAEEMGGFVALSLILLCLSCFLKFIQLSSRMRLPFYRVLSVGLAVIYGAQCILSIGGNIKFIPATGVTLPFVSYGGSSLAASFILFSLMQEMFIKRYITSEAEARMDATPLIPEETAPDPEETDPAVQGGTRTKKTAGNRAVLVGGIILSVVMGLMFLYLVYFEIFKRTEVTQSPYNNRYDSAAAKVVRGPIETSDGAVIAVNRTGEDGNERRVYPYDELFSPVTGYERMGRTGLEQRFNSRLMSADLRLGTLLKNDLLGIRSPGDTLVTTIDSALQYSCYNALGDRNGSVLVMDVKTGAIRAMVSRPTFNANTIEEDWAVLTDPENKSGALLNRTLQGLYSPGSTFKIVTAIAYMKEHPRTYPYYTYECKGSYELDGVTVRCGDGRGHGTVDIEHAMAYSCNAAFIDMGLSLDKGSYAELASSLGFGKTLFTDLPSRVSRFALTKDSDDFELMQTAFGQGKTMETPLQNLLITAMVANGGRMPKPYIVEQIRNGEGAVLYQAEPAYFGTFLEKKDCAYLNECLKAVVTYGTAPQAGSPYAAVAGKSGSAQYDETLDALHAWFTAYAPADDPEIAIVVMLEKGGSGSRDAGPVVSEIVSSYFAR
ncbi:MAG: FtsW/RodA/SpoVE family cell cycle protein [Lachnospiraceae bacterium]|nr:FtsW/RodA/SpoVE family cell cycle protein [Lachnospiraceae bacterium]